MKIVIPKDASDVQFFDDHGNNISHVFAKIIGKLTVQPISTANQRTCVTMELVDVDIELDVAKEHAVVYDKDYYDEMARLNAAEAAARFYALGNKGN